MASWLKSAPAAQFLFEHCDFALGFRVGGGFIVFAIVDRRIGVRRDHDLRDVILRLGDIELCAIFLVEVGDVLIGDRNFGDDFAIETASEPRAGGGCRS